VFAAALVVVWLASAASTLVVGVSAGVALNHEAAVLVATALTAPTSWLLLLPVVWLSISIEFFSSSPLAWTMWVAGVAGSAILQVWLFRWARRRG